MGAAASHGRPPPLHLTPDTAGVVLSLEPYEHFTLTLDVLPPHQRSLLAATERGLYPSISVTAALTHGGVSRIQLHLNSAGQHHHPHPAAYQPVQGHPQQLLPSPDPLPDGDGGEWSAERRLVAVSSAAGPVSVELRLLGVDCGGFRPTGYPLSITNLDRPTLLTLTAECRIDNPLSLQRDLRILHTDHHRMAWQLHAAQQQIQQLHAQLLVAHSTPHPFPSTPPPESLSTSSLPIQPADEPAPSVVEALAQLMSNHPTDQSPSPKQRCRFLRSHLIAWRSCTLRRAALRAEASSSVLRNSQRLLLRSAWLHWLSSCSRRAHDANWQARVVQERMKRAEVLIAGHLKRSTSTVFRAWQGWVRERRQRRLLLVEAMRGKQELTRQWRVWKKWTNRVHQRRVEAARARLQQSQELLLHHQQQLHHQTHAFEPPSVEPAVSAAPPTSVAAPVSRPTRSVEALLGRMLQGTIRTSFLAWRATVQRHRQQRSRALTLMLGKQQRMTAQLAFRRWKAWAAITRKQRVERTAEEQRKRSLPSLVDRLKTKGNRRLLRQLFLRWKDWQFARKEQKRDALRLLCAIRAKEEVNAAWRVWTAHGSEGGVPRTGRRWSLHGRVMNEEKEGDYVATIIAPRALPVVGMSRTLPSGLPSTLTSLPSSSPSSSSPTSSALSTLRAELSSLQRVYSRLFLLVQSFRSEVIKEWRANESQLLEHSSCRCDPCKMRALAGARGAGLQTVWMKRFDRELEHFRYVL